VLLVEEAYGVLNCETDMNYFRSFLKYQVLQQNAIGFAHRELEAAAAPRLGLRSNLESTHHFWLLVYE
jgi:hypothetical protein